MDTPSLSADADKAASAPIFITLAATALSLIDSGSPPGPAETSSRRALHALLPDRRRAWACEHLVLACMRVTDGLDGGIGASWVLPPTPGGSPNIDLHRRLLRQLQDRHRNDMASPDMADAAAADYDLRDVEDALSDLTEIALLTVLNTVRAQRQKLDPQTGEASTDGALLRRCLDLVATAIIDHQTSG